MKAELGIPADWRPVAPTIVGRPKALPTLTPREKPRIVWCR